MNFAFNEEQEALRDSARAFLADQSSSERVRAAMETETGYDEAVWERIAAEMGWTAVTVPEELGGLGLGQVELAAIMEEMGSTLLCSPFFSTVVLSANVLLSAPASDRRDALLGAIAAGEKTVALAVHEPRRALHALDFDASAKKSVEGFVIEGEKAFVVDGHTADELIVACRTQGTEGGDGVSLFLVSRDAPGVGTEFAASMDQTRKLARVTLSGVQVGADALIGGWEDGAPALTRGLDLAAIALGAEQMGGAQRCLDMTVEYVQERVQFGRAVGSFQAVKHKCADMLLQVESARSAAYYAACAADAGDEELPMLAALAKTYCSEAYFHCAADAIQLHGGVGFTWEYDVHLHFKRARAGEQFMGTPSHHREELAKMIGL